MIKLSKVAIVTGSSRGIGQAIAIEFAKAGYGIVINSRDQEELSISKQEIMKVTDSTINVLEFPGDISEGSPVSVTAYSIKDCIIVM